VIDAETLRKVELLGSLPADQLDAVAHRPGR
jgi:hypothetical protein